MHKCSKSDRKFWKIFLMKNQLYPLIKVLFVYIFKLCLINHFKKYSKNSVEETTDCVKATKVIFFKVIKENFTETQKQSIFINIFCRLSGS